MFKPGEKHQKGQPVTTGESPFGGFTFDLVPRLSGSCSCPCQGRLTGALRPSAADRRREQDWPRIHQKRLQTQEETPGKQGGTTRTVVFDVYRCPVFSESPLGFGVSSGNLGYWWGMVLFFAGDFLQRG